MTEQTSRLADIEFLTAGMRWRWAMVCVGAALLVFARSLGLSEIPLWPLVWFVALGVVANLTLIRLLRSDGYRQWLAHAFCLIDVCLVALAIIYLGPGGTIAGFFLVVLPCSFRPNRALGLFALCTTSVAFLIAAFVHGLLSGGTASGLVGLPSSVFRDLLIFIAVAVTLMAAHTDLFGRIAVVHSAISNANEGAFDRKTPARRNDLLGQLEQSLNFMLEQVASTIAAVQVESEEVAVLARRFAESSSVAGESSRQVALMASELALELHELKSAAESGETESAAAAQEARTLQSRAEGEVGETVAFEETIQLGRDRVVRTSESVLAIGADINRATSIVSELGGLSQQIGSSARSIAKVARHTHVLALNAAIEAARAEEHGKEFAVVADQVRTLAGEAGGSARDVGDLISEVQAGIGAAATALVAGEEKVSEISLIVSEARSALHDLRAGASNATDLVSATAEISKSQVIRAGSLASKMTQIAENSARWSINVTETTKTIETQNTALNSLDRANKQLVDLAERLRNGIAPFSTRRTDRASSGEESDD